MKNLKFKTFSPKQENIQPRWLLVDVKGKTLGRIATKIADALRGKNKPHFSNHVVAGDYIVVINAAEIKLTGKKMTQKEYNKHSRYPGGLKTATPEELIRANKAEDIIIHAVAGMIPQNKLKKVYLKRLKVFSGSEHDLAAQNPQPVEL